MFMVSLILMSIHMSFSCWRDFQFCPAFLCFPVPPVIEGNSEAVEELTTILDTSVSIQCVATGSPPPQLNWLRNGLPMPLSSHVRLLSAGQVLR